MQCAKRVLTLCRDEHYRREPDCRFFSLISSQPAPKKSARTKAARSSKASRLSIQSFANLPDMSSADNTAEVDDSVLATASKTSKKPTNAKKTTTTTARGRKTRAKKDDAVEIHEDEPEVDGETAPQEHPKPARGRKRGSEEVEDSIATNSEAPPHKKRTTKTRKRRGSDATEVSQPDADMLDGPEVAKKPAAKKGTRKAPGTRKASGTRGRKGSVSTTTSAATAASTASPAPQIPDDEEIDRQLQADLDRPLSGDEEDTLDAVAARTSQEAEKPTVEAEDPLSHTAKTDFAMFDPSPVEPSDAQIEADLQSMEDEMKPEPVEPDTQPTTEEAEAEPEKSEIIVPKKGRKAGGVRKVSKQTAAKQTAKEIAANIERAQARMTVEAEEPDEIAEADVSFGSTATTVRKSLSRASLGSVASTKGTAKRGRPKKVVSQDAVEEPATSTAANEPEVSSAPDAMETDEEPGQAVAEQTQKRPSNGKRGRPSKKSKTPDEAADEAAPVEAPVEPEAAPADTEKLPSFASTPFKVARKPIPAPKDSPFAIREMPAASALDSPFKIASVAPKTPRHKASPVQSAKQATVSPSPSPQASDAENRPPSSKPNTASSKRPALGDLPTTTPVRHGSPSKQQPATGSLETSEPWTAVDLDLVFQDFHGDQDDAKGAARRFFAKGGELTTAEREMSVEEWVYYNASQAEQKLKFECETMVMAFEREGTRALRSLEGLLVEEA